MRWLAARVRCRRRSRARAGAAADELHHRISLAGGGEVYATPDFNGHGFFLLRYDLDGLPRGAHLAVELNTDTLRLWYDRLRVGHFEFGFGAAGEVLLAGILSDYYRDGINDSTRGFCASYVTAAAVGQAEPGAALRRARRRRAPLVLLAQRAGPTPR